MNRYYGRQKKRMNKLWLILLTLTVLLSMSCWHDIQGEMSKKNHRSWELKFKVVKALMYLLLFPVFFCFKLNLESFSKKKKREYKKMKEHVSRIFPLLKGQICFDDGGLIWCLKGMYCWLKKMHSLKVESCFIWSKIGT